MAFPEYDQYDGVGLAALVKADPALPDGPLQGVPWFLKELATAWTGQPHTTALRT